MHSHHAFGLYPSPAECSIVTHIVLELTSLAHQPKLRERLVHPKRHVTFLHVRSKNQHIQLTHQNLMKMMTTPDRTIVCGDEDEDDDPLVRGRIKRSLDTEQKSRR